MALCKPARNTKQVTHGLQLTYIGHEDRVLPLKHAILTVAKVDVLKESDSVKTSKPVLTRPPSTNDLSLQAYQDGKLKGFESTRCNTYQTCVEATSKPACLNCDNQQSSLMVVSYNNLGLLSTISCWRLVHANVYLGDNYIFIRQIYDLNAIGVQQLTVNCP